MDQEFEEPSQKSKNEPKMSSVPVPGEAQNNSTLEESIILRQPCHPCGNSDVLPSSAPSPPVKTRCPKHVVFSMNTEGDCIVAYKDHDKEFNTTEYARHTHLMALQHKRMVKFQEFMWKNNFLWRKIERIREAVLMYELHTQKQFCIVKRFGYCETTLNSRLETVSVNFSKIERNIHDFAVILKTYLDEVLNSEIRYIRLCHYDLNETPKVGQDSDIASWLTRDLQNLAEATQKMRSKWSDLEKTIKGHLELVKKWMVPFCEFYALKYEEPSIPFVEGNLFKNCPTALISWSEYEHNRLMDAFELVMNKYGSFPINSCTCSPNR